MFHKYRLSTIYLFIPAILFLFLTACQNPAGETVIAAAVATVEIPTALPTATATLPPSPTPQPTTTPTHSPTPSPTSSPTITPTPTATSTTGPTDTPLPTETPTVTPTPVVIHGLTPDQFIIMPEEVIAHSREIFATGQERGRDPTHFSRVGDSTIDTIQFLNHFDTGPYNLGGYAYLETTIDYFAGSFNRPGVAVRQGLSTFTVMDPMWADNEACLPNEHLLACEIRLYDPAVLIIKLGTNDSSYLTLDKNLREVVAFVIEQGVIPVIGTKANRIEGDNSYNNVMRQIAADYAVPLWDFDRIADKLPERGLDQDGVHLIAFREADYTLSYAMWSGYGPLNLSALMMLDAIRQGVLPPLE